MISKRMETALNNQINAELYSSYLYLSMSAHFESANLPGAAGWMAAQAQEENAHAMRMYKYVHDQGGKVSLKAIDGPPATWPSPLAAFKDALKHEKKVTAMIGKLVDQAKAENDHATEVFLQWFVKEQVEEEKSAGDVVQMLQMVGDSKNGLFMADRQLGERGGE